MIQGLALLEFMAVIILLVWYCQKLKKAQEMSRAVGAWEWLCWRCCNKELARNPPNGRGGSAGLAPSRGLCWSACAMCCLLHQAHQSCSLAQKKIPFGNVKEEKKSLAGQSSPLQNE